MSIHRNDDGVPGLNRYALWAYACTFVFAVSFGSDLYRMPIQISDSLSEIVSAQATPSVSEAFSANLGQQAYLRPLRIAQIKAIFDASRGQYHLAYRGFHTALFVATLFCFTYALRVSTAVDLAAAAFALTVFLGIHTFSGAVGSAYPINHFLEMIFFSLVALNIAQGNRSTWLRDIAAVLTFAAAALTLESGLLVWVVLVAARLFGFRGVSWRGVAAASVLLGGYAYIRFIYFDTGTPQLIERASGFGFERLEPEDLQARFGATPLYFYAYNVVSSFLSVLAAEPRAGVFAFTRSWSSGEVPPWATVAVVSSIATTVVMAAAAWKMIRLRWWERDAALMGLFVAVLLANAAMSYAYTKDEIVGVAGAFYAIAAFASVRFFMNQSPRLTPRSAVLPLMGVLLVASSGWVIRTAGLHHVLLSQTFKQRVDWTTLPRISVDTDEARTLVRQLRADALSRPALAPRFVPRWTDRWFEEE